MPEKNGICINYQNKSYCWNYETCRVDIYTTVESAPIAECPACVIGEIAKLLSGKAAAAEDGGKSA